MQSNAQIVLLVYNFLAAALPFYKPIIYRRIKQLHQMT